jgi:hypothetical protein
LSLGDYLPGRSDVDLLVVVDDALTETQRAALEAGAEERRPPAPVPVDLTQGRHPGERDPVIEFSICRAHRRSILGAPAAELIGEVPQEWVLESATRNSPTGWQSVTTRLTHS